MSEISKPKTIFDILNDISFRKVPWYQQLESDRKKIQPYMINRWLSMDEGYLELVAECQPITDSLTTKQYYQFYSDLLPKKKFFTKYISNKLEKDKKYGKLIEFISQRMKVSEKEAEEYLDILFELPTGYSQLKEFVKQYGYNDKEVTKEFGL